MATVARTPSGLEETARTAERVRGVHDAFNALARHESLADLVAAVPREACVGCGFDRAMLLHVREERVAFVAGANVRDEVDSTEFERIARTIRARLADCPPELEVVSTQQPLVVRQADRPDAPVFRPVAQFLGVRDYVVAPIVQAGFTIGLIGADRYASGAPLTELDAELLASYATGVGWAMRQAVAGDHGEMPVARRAERVAGSLAALVRDWAAFPGGWAHEADGDGPDAVAVDGAALGQLSCREREVLDLLTEGLSNSQIAERLVLSEATVKSHVRAVLRKLGAANRTQAVAKYHVLTGGARLGRG